MKMNISCKEATLLIAKSEEKKISIIEKLLLRIHLNVCPPCKNYQLQDRVITKALKTQVSISKLTDEDKSGLITTITLDDK